jgi:hypothetical protein
MTTGPLMYYSIFSVYGRTVDMLLYSDVPASMACFLCLCTFRPLTSSSSSPPLPQRRKLKVCFDSFDGMRIVLIIVSRAEFWQRVLIGSNISMWWWYQRLCMHPNHGETSERLHQHCWCLWDRSPSERCCYQNTH